ncbi:MAG: S-layer homology domain-containing protein [Monoglobaceae bacterium]
MMKHNTWSIIIAIVCFLNVLCGCKEIYVSAEEYESIDKINISVNIMPIKESKYCYNFTAVEKSQIAYIIHFLNSLTLVNDGVVLNGADIPIINIDIIREDGSVKKCGFISGRFYEDSVDKQYAIDKNEYSRFLNFIYALKSEQIVLDEKVTFEPSEWANEDIDKAIENGLVPKWNRINYVGNITRLEVCQLVDNFTKKKNISNAEITEKTFSDTGDKSVTNLFGHGIVNGKSDDEFCPYDYITREELAKIIARTYHVIGSKQITGSKSVLYTDMDKISAWAVDDVNEMSVLGIFEGSQNGEFEPHRSITKEEVIVILNRLDSLVQ